MSGEAIVVFTSKSVETLLDEGGSSEWRLDRSHARQCEYLVCTRNAHSDWNEGMERHGAAFLVGRIADITPASNGRWLIEFSEYALVDIPDVWKGWHNPIRYISLDDLGIDPSKLQFRPMPNSESELPVSGEKIGALKFSRLTMAEAKRGLAATYGVSPDAIEIVIRG